MKTRSQYITGEISHDEYYSQFVTPGVIERVKSRIGEKKIKQSSDPHFNDIPLNSWDVIGVPADVVTKCGLAGDSNTLSFQVCVNKAAARIIKG